MFWRNLFHKKTPYEKLMEVYPKEGYHAWKIPDSKYFSFGVIMKEHDVREKIENDNNRLREITNKAAGELGLEAIVEGPVFLAGGVYGVFVYLEKKSA